MNQLNNSKRENHNPEIHVFELSTSNKTIEKHPPTKRSKLKILKNLNILKFYYFPTLCQLIKTKGVTKPSDTHEKLVKQAFRFTDNKQTNDWKIFFILFDLNPHP